MKPSGTVPYVRGVNPQRDDGSPSKPFLGWRHLGWSEGETLTREAPLASDEIGKAIFERYHEQAEQYSKWHLALSKLTVSEQELGVFRVKGRRVKTYMLERLQQIVDAQFDAYYSHVVASITNIKLTGSR